MGAISAGAGLAGGIVGNIASSDERRNARDRMSEAMGEIMSVGLPPDLSARLILEKYKQAGTLTPQMEAEITQAATELNKIQEVNPEAKQAQMNALQLLGKSAKAGLTPEDRLAYNKLRAETQRDAEAKRQQIMQQFQARGQGGSGNELIAQLQGGQSAADRMSMAGDEISAQAAANRMSAISALGSLGQNIRAQDYGIASDKASAQDVINAANTQMAASRQMRNIGSQNQAQQFNLEGAQDISNKNVSMENEETRRQNEAKRQFWMDKMDRARARSQALSGAAQMAQQEGARQAQMWQSIGSGVGSGVGAGMQYGQNERMIDAYNSKGSGQSNIQSLPDTSNFGKSSGSKYRLR